jgi:nucleotide-binding universal stress UspA family protein
LERIAAAASEALELKDVFAAVADAAAEILPFDRMAVLQFDGTHTLRLHSFAGSVPAPPPTEVGLEDFSPAVRPSLDGARRIDDLGPVLSPLYKVDRWWSEQGMRSALWVPVILRGHPAGFLCLTSRRPGIFTPEHQTALGSISALVGLALEHERLWTLDVARRRRLEAIDQLLPTMAEGLEVRGLFDRISKVVQPILPHDRLILVSRSADGRVDTVDALSGDPATAIPSRVDLGPGDRPPTPEYELVRDFEDEADGPRRRVSRSEGIRSALSIRLWIDHTGSAQVDVRRLSSGGGDVGRLLLSQAAAFSADLVVMGAYGHSHLNAWMFGSVTRTVLREAGLPVLMSR